MDTQEIPEKGNQNRKTLLIVAAIVSGVLCCCAVGLVLYFGLLLYIAPKLTKTIAPQTPTPISLEEVNSTSPLGKFYFGLDDVNDACVVIRQTSEVSQEELLRSQYIYFSAHFDKKEEGQTVYWSVYDTKGQKIEDDSRKESVLSSAQNNCLKAVIVVNPHTQPGRYVFEVTYNKQIAYRHVFTVKYSDLSKIPRPNRKPFGAFKLGRSIHTAPCTISDQSGVYSLADGPWVYFMSPFQVGDVDKKVYWSVFDPGGKSIFGKVERTVVDNINLCFWQGFSMENEPAGKYRVVIEDDKGVVLYETTFELK